MARQSRFGAESDLQQRTRCAVYEVMMVDQERQYLLRFNYHHLRTLSAAAAPRTKAVTAGRGSRFPGDEVSFIVSSRCCSASKTSVCGCSLWGQPRQLCWSCSPRHVLCRG